MRIKRLEIVGFKSFCDRTVLHFDEPITGVVGPNGCGKSNVVDAIRWCMGEQSAKYLRGKAMEDVIFAGSDARGGAGMAEVSLTFENDGRVPVEFLSFSEITVTRRLYRDGTSEYLINNTPCRLRDVTDFFLGTGIGAKAYSIIEQGKVGLIVSSKPEDRRALIEEAAGITKYKLKKKAAEKKIEAARQNLLRVTDVVTEIEKQLGSLRRQAQKAERYKQYKAEVRDIELWSASQRWLGFLCETRVVREILEEETAKKGGQQSLVVSREAEIATARLRASEDERRLAALQQTLYETDNRIKLGEAENEHATREAADLDERGHTAKGELEGLARQLEAWTVDGQRLGREMAAVEEARLDEQEELRERESVHRRLKEELGEAQRELDAAKAAIAIAQADIARCDAAERSHARRAEDLDVRIARVRDEDNRHQARATELESEIGKHEASLAELEQVQRTRQTERELREERLAEVKELARTVERELNEARTELTRRRSRQHSLEEIHERYEGFAKGTRAIMKEYRTANAEGETRWGVRGLVADVIGAPAGYEGAIEAALGERLGSIVVDSPEVGLDGIDFLKDKKQGRTSFVPLRARAGVEATAGEAVEGIGARLVDVVEAGEEYRGLVRALFGDTVLVDDALTGVDLWKAGERRRMVTREGEVIDASGVLSGGSRESQGAGVLEQKRELRELEVIVSELAAKVCALEERSQSLQEERQDLDATIEALRRAKHEGEIGVLTHQKDLHRLREELERLSSRASGLARDAEDLVRQRADVERERSEQQGELLRVRERMSVAEEQRELRGRACVGLYDRVEEAQGALTEFKIVAAKSEEKRAGLSEARARVIAQLRDGESRRERLDRSINEGGARALELRAAVAERVTALVQLVTESQAARSAIETGRDAYEKNHGELLRAEAEIKAARSALNALVEKVNELELKLRELEWSRTHLEEQVTERWRVAIADEVHAHHLRPPVTEDEEARLSELRELIDRMGEINLTAIDEFKVLEARYDFLSAQKLDLETALVQLEEAIAQINTASRRRFQEVFDLVNGKFQELFPRLFRGGHARLSLTDSEDILEAGIEIVAQPPGKKNTTIEQLSGGEKALTAVSLIFAIFLVKPSPFCILDEVDAPLDEANVGRFNDLVRTMTDRSQFIIITHNKRTMEIVDTLYGVTMEQPGISKLVSVNLTTAVKRVAA